LHFVKLPLDSKFPVCASLAGDFSDVFQISPCSPIACFMSKNK